MRGLRVFREDLQRTGQDCAGAVGFRGRRGEEEGRVGGPEGGGFGAVLFEGSLVEGVGFL